MSPPGRKRSRKITLTDIAASLDLSVATASMALRDYPQVNDVTRERVREACERLGYKPVARRSSTWRGPAEDATPIRLAFVMVDERRHHKINSAGELETLTRLCPSMGVSLEIGMIQSRAPGEQAADLARLAAGVDALVLYGFVTTTLLEAVRLTIPAVLLGDLRGHYLTQSSRITHVTSDARAMGELATQRLIEAGHESIAFICSALNTGMWFERWLIGYRHAHVQAGLPLDANLEWIIGSRPNAGALAARHARTATPSPSAYVIPDPRTASTFLDAMETADRLPPREAVVIGGSTHRIEEYGVESYPYVAQDEDRLVLTVLRYLRAMIDGHEFAPCTIQTPFVCHQVKPVHDTPHVSPEGNRVEAM